jgi:hypothetical protein
MGKLVALVTIISFLATACTWRDCARTTAYAVGSTAVLLTGNADAYGFNEHYGGQVAADLVDSIYDATNATN